MTLQSSGQMSIGQIVTEKGVTPTAGGNYSFKTLSDTDINDASVSKPNGIAPHSVSEFYGYDHAASGEGTQTFYETVFDTEVDVVVQTNSPTVTETLRETIVETVYGDDIQTFTVNTAGQTFFFNTEGAPYTHFDTQLVTENTNYDTLFDTVVGQTEQETSRITSHFT